MSEKRENSNNLILSRTASFSDVLISDITGSNQEKMGNFVIFFPQNVLALSWPSPLGDWQKYDPLLDRYYMVCSKGNLPCHRNSEHFACERKMFEYKYVSILNVRELKQENANNQCWILTEANDCTFRRYEELHLRSLKQQITIA